jgi:hypothetical protein
MRARGPRDWWDANDTHIDSSAADGLERAGQLWKQNCLWTQRERHHIYDGRAARRRPDGQAGDRQLQIDVGDLAMNCES